jgi:hypothetical protein
MLYISYCTAPSRLREAVSWAPVKSLMIIYPVLRLNICRVLRKENLSAIAGGTFVKRIYFTTSVASWVCNLPDGTLRRPDGFDYVVGQRLEAFDVRVLDF